MNLIFKPDFAPSASGMYRYLSTNVVWVNRDAPRDECFMSKDSASYTYGKGYTRTYLSVPLDKNVESIMLEINRMFKSEYNVCFLNWYKDGHQHLGWHSDDSVEMDINHPIAVVSFGATRDIWVKEKSYKGVIPEKDKYPLNDGSIFIMPTGYQKEHLHKIPKSDRVCGGRISLTFRKFIAKDL